MNINNSKYLDVVSTISPAIIDIGNNRVKNKSESDMIPQLRDNKLLVNCKKSMFDGNSATKSITKAVIGGSKSGR